MYSLNLFCQCRLESHFRIWQATFCQTYSKWNIYSFSKRVEIVNWKIRTNNQLRCPFYFPKILRRLCFCEILGCLNDAWTTMKKALHFCNVTNNISIQGKWLEERTCHLQLFASVWYFRKRLAKIYILSQVRDCPDTLWIHWSKDRIWENTKRYTYWRFNLLETVSLLGVNWIIYLWVFDNVNTQNISWSSTFLRMRSV